MIECLSKIGKSLLDLLYPPLCLHCKESLENGNPIFCTMCSSLLTFIDREERCPYCFSSHFTPGTATCCQSCLEYPLLFDRVASAFDYEGPPATLIKQLKYGGQIHLAKGAAAFLVAQFISLEWPMPDVIVPMPSSFLRRLERGFNQSLLIAETFGQLVNRPVKDILIRTSGDFSQAGLNHEQRLKLRSSSFELKPGISLHDKCVLVIDDVMTTGSSLRCCAEALLPSFPKSLYAMTVCRTI
ncbi:MAG: ComF family protein [Parachlamydiaceae bacterium]